MVTSLHSHLTQRHSQTIPSFRSAFCSYSLTSQRFLQYSTPVSPPHFYHYNSLSASVCHISNGHFSLFLSVLSAWRACSLTFLSLSPSLTLMPRMRCHFVWQVFESPVEENRGKVLISHRLAGFPFFPHLLFKRRSKAMLNLSTHFSSCHCFWCSFLRISASPLCVHQEAITLVLLSWKDIFTQTG